MDVKDVKILQYGSKKIDDQLKLYYDISCVDENIRDNFKQIYKRWYDMYYRCYSEKLHERAPSYIGCSVCDGWRDFNNYLNWYKESFYEVIIDGKKCKMDLDKDILCKGNKVYSPEYCIFVPHEINILFVNAKKNRGDLPLGVSWDSSKNKYRAEVRSKKLGTFKTPEQAFAVFKREKEKLIKETAKKFKDQIPDKLYQAMIHWKIEITD